MDTNIKEVAQEIYQDFYTIPSVPICIDCEIAEHFKQEWNSYSVSEIITSVKDAIQTKAHDISSNIVNIALGETDALIRAVKLNEYTQSIK